MSTAVLEPVVEQPIVVELAKLDFAPAGAALSVPEEKWSDPHPLLPVFIAGAVSLVLTGAFIGSILSGWPCAIPASWRLKSAAYSATICGCTRWSRPLGLR